MTTSETEVLIVGAGPTGMTAAILLARMGVAFELVERRDGPQRAPAAHCLSARSFEIWRQAGVDMDALLALASDPRDAGRVYWVTRLGGEILGSLPYERQGDEVLEVTPTPLRNLSQHRLEPLLSREMERICGRGPRYLERWESSTEDAGGVTSVVRGVAGDTTRTIRSRYVIAADGAGSPVRKSLGIAFTGPERIQSFVMIHFEANLRAFVGSEPGVLYFIGDPACPGVFVAHDLDREWVFMQPWDPDSEDIRTYDAARCEGLVRRAMQGSEGVPITIRTAAPWMMTSQVAERWREGRVFLAGDAAHRFPPTGGLGLNSGVQDAHNLTWKLAAVLGGGAGPALLDSYEQERKPVARYNADQSLANAMKMVEVQIALGTVAPPDEAAANFAAALADPARREAVAEAVANQATHFDMLGLQMGYRYDGAAIADDGSAAPVAADAVREFVPSARPGSRLPHGWIDIDGKRGSTIDLVVPGGWTLIVANGSPWKAAASLLALPLRVVEWGSDLRGDDAWWIRTAGLAEGGALLVRPDQHVAARFGAAPTDAGAVLEKTLRAVTGLARE